MKWNMLEFLDYLWFKLLQKLLHFYIFNSVCDNSAMACIECIEKSRFLLF